MVLVVSRFGFGGWVWVLVASVPDFCIRFTVQVYLSFKLRESGKTLKKAFEIRFD